MRTTVFWYKTAVLVLLSVVLDALYETRNLADAARVNAARSLDCASEAASNAEQAYSEAAYAAEACTR